MPGGPPHRQLYLLRDSADLNSLFHLRILLHLHAGRRFPPRPPQFKGPAIIDLHHSLDPHCLASGHKSQASASILRDQIAGPHHHPDAALSHPISTSADQLPPQARHDDPHFSANDDDVFDIVLNTFECHFQNIIEGTVAEPDWVEQRIHPLKPILRRHLPLDVAASEAVADLDLP